jgi:protein-S-isoprenylcysteine O-methyltransferase Ste14
VSAHAGQVESVPVHRGLRPILAMLARRFGLPLLCAVFFLTGTTFGIALVSLALVAVWTALEARAEDVPANRAATTSPADRGTRAWVLGAHLLAVHAPIIERSFFPSLVAPLSLLVPVGWVLMLGGAALRLLSVYSLGASFTAHVRVILGQRLCTTGLYSRLRHPSYVGLFFLNVGPAVALSAPISALLAFVNSLLSLHVRIQVEETTLLEHFGDEYRSYMRRTRSWIPLKR